MHRKTTILLLLAALCATAATVSRITDTEVADNIQLDVAEISAHVAADGTASLFFGTSDHGTVRVSDPFAVHFAPRRLLEPGEYVVRFDSGYYRPDGSIVLAEHVTTGVVTNRLTIESVTPGIALAFATCDLSGAGYIARPWEVSDGSIGRLFFIQSEKIGGVGQDGSLVVSNIQVWAWTSDRRDATWDAITETVILHDSMGSVPMSDLRRWVADRYDGRTAEDWSRHPATNTVSLAGQTIRFNASGSLSLRHDGVAATNAMRILSNGHPMLSFVPGFSSSSPGTAFRIADMALGATTITLYVSADLGTPVTIQSVVALQSSDWIDVLGQTSTYPDTVTRTLDGSPVSCYAVTVPIDLGAPSAFYRAMCTTDGNAVAEIRIDNANLYIDGRRVAWREISVGGATINVLAEVQE